MTCGGERLFGGGAVAGRSRGTLTNQRPSSSGRRRNRTMRVHELIAGTLERARVEALFAVIGDANTRWLADPSTSTSVKTYGAARLPMRRGGQRFRPSRHLAEEATGVLEAAEPPMIPAGRGARLSDVRTSLLKLAEQSGALLAAALLAKGYFRGQPFDLLRVFIVDEGAVGAEYHHLRTTGLKPAASLLRSPDFVGLVQGFGCIGVVSRPHGGHCCEARCALGRAWPACIRRPRCPGGALGDEQEALVSRTKIKVPPRHKRAQMSS